MATTTSVNQLGGVTSYEEYQRKDLYAASGNGTLGKDTFLKLLTTQLQHQDPLNPMDNSEFVAQLSQFSSLEQLTNANDNLLNMAVGMNSVGNATMVNLIGKEVKAVGDGFSYQKGVPETLNYRTTATAEKVTVNIYDEAGNVVLSKNLGSLEEGDHTFAWDGKNANGVVMAGGNYTFSVVASNGSTSVETVTYTQGLVDQIDFTSGVAMPRIDGQAVTVDKIVQILDGE